LWLPCGCLVVALWLSCLVWSYLVVFKILWLPCGYLVVVLSCLVCNSNTNELRLGASDVKNSDEKSNVEVSGSAQNTTRQDKTTNNKTRQDSNKKRKDNHNHKTRDKTRHGMT
jgi:hypothetical protein